MMETFKMLKETREERKKEFLERVIEAQIKSDAR